MGQDNLLVYLLTNISLLFFVAAVITEIRPLRTVLQRQSNHVLNQLAIGFILGLLSICSTYIGLSFQGAIVNTRVISTVAAGLVGGPIAGIFAGVLAGAHRFFYDFGGFTSLSCAVGTFLFGVIGAFFYPLLPSYRRRSVALVGITIFSELVQAFFVLTLSKPFSAALALEKAILLPKIIVNSIGLILFMSILDRLNREISIEFANQHSLALLIAEKCMPFLREGMENIDAMGKAIDAIRSVRPDFRVALADTKEFIAWRGFSPKENSLPPCVVEAMAQKTVQSVSPPPNFSPLFSDDALTQVAAPLYSDGQVIGCLYVLVHTGPNNVLDGEVRVIEALSNLFSTMLELGHLQQQIDLRREAEFRALQAQITPHFLFNALNTISAMCLTAPDKARENILTLANYFRQTLLINEPFVTLEQELSNVENYLALTKARFEDMIHVTWDLPAPLPALELPPLILQPIVENAVRHGGTTVSNRNIHIQITPREEETYICVSDKGHGFPPQLLEKLTNPSDPTYTGLFNVRNRLRYIYGARCKFTVQSSPHGSSISFCVPTQQDKGAAF